MRSYSSILIFLLFISGNLYSGVDVWTTTGPYDLGGASVSAVAIHPEQTGKIWVGTEQSGLFKSGDSGENWVHTGQYAQAIKAIVFDPVNPQIIYLAAGKQIFRSSDDGQSWEDRSGGIGSGAFCLASKPAASGVLFAGTWGAGIFKTVDQGVNWVAMNAGLTEKSIYTLAIETANPNTMYAGTKDGIFKSANSGANWVQLGLENKYVTSIAIDGQNALVLYAGVLGEGVYKSTDGGLSWNLINSGLTGNWVRCLTISTQNPNILYAGIGPQGIFKTRNGGSTWESTCPDANPGFAGIQIDPKNDNIVYATDAKSVYKTQNGGALWLAKYEGLICSNVFSIVIDPIRPQTILCLTSDIGLQKSVDQGQHWTKIGEFPIYSVTSNGLKVHPQDNKIIFITSENKVYRSVNGGVDFEAVLTRNCFFSCLSFDPQNPSTIYAGSLANRNPGGDPGNIYKSTNGGNSWEAIGDPLWDWMIDIAAVAASPEDDKYIYVGTGYQANPTAETYTSGVYRFPAYNNTWLQINNGLPDPLPNNFQVREIVVDPVDPSVLFLATNYGVFKSGDRGNNWSAVNTGLESVKIIFDLEFAPTNPNWLYAGTDLGVFRSGNKGESWMPFNAGLPGNRVYSMAINPVDFSHIYAGTDGNGVYSIQVSPPTFPPERVNEDALGADQIEPAIAQARDGTYMIAWTERSRTECNVVAQVFEWGGQKIGQNIRIFSSKSDFSSPVEIAVTPAGDFLIVWADYEQNKILGQIFDKYGNKVGTQMTLAGQAAIPGIAMQENGNFLLVYQNPEMIGNIFKITGEPIRPEYSIAIGEQGITGYPDVAVTKDGFYVVVWQAERYGAIEKIFAQRISATGDKIGNNIRVDITGEAEAACYHPAVAVAADSSFVVVWEDGSITDICGRRYNSAGEPIGNRFNLHGGSTQGVWPSVAFSDGGSFIIVWSDNRNGHYEIFGQKFFNDGSWNGVNYRISPVSKNVHQNNPKAIFTFGGGYDIHFVWQDNRELGQGWDIFQRTECVFLPTNRINNDLTGFDQFNPSAAAAGDGSRVVAWIDRRMVGGEIYAQAFGATGNRLWTFPLKISDTRWRLSSGNSGKVSIAQAQSGEFIIVWENIETSEIFAQRFHSVSSRNGDNFKVGDGFQPDVAMTPDGAFSIAYALPGREDNLEIARYTNLGEVAARDTLLGGRYNHYYHPEIAIAPGGAYVVAYYNARGDEYPGSYGDRVRAAYFDADGNLLQSIPVDDKPSDDHEQNLGRPVVAMNADGTFVIVYRDGTAGNTLVGKHYDVNGNLLKRFEIVDRTLYSPPAVAANQDGGFVVSWTDNLDNIPTIFARRYSSDAIPFGDVFPVRAQDDLAAHGAVTVAFTRNTLCFFWQADYGNGQGLDIFYRNVEVPPVVISAPEVAEIPSQFRLLQNFPNPFNPQTTIDYQLAERAPVSITIFNSLGQAIKQFTYVSQPAGRYSIHWDGTDAQGLVVVSGIYFCRLEAGHFQATRKLLFLK